MNIPCLYPFPTNISLLTHLPSTKFTHDVSYGQRFWSCFYTASTVNFCSFLLSYLSISKSRLRLSVGLGFSLIFFLLFFEFYVPADLKQMAFFHFRSSLSLHSLTYSSYQLMRWLVPLSTLAALQLPKWADVLQPRIKPSLSILHALQHKLLTPATTEAIAVLGNQDEQKLLCIKGKATSAAEKWRGTYPLPAVQMLLKSPTIFFSILYCFVHFHILF